MGLLIFRLPTFSTLPVVAGGGGGRWEPGGHLRVGIDRQSGQDRGRSQGHWRRVIKERGEGGGRESGCEGLWTPTCDSSGDGHGDECLSAFG